MINIKNFDPNLIDKKSYKTSDIYYIGYIAIKNISGCESNHSVIPFYFIVAEVDGYNK